MCGNDQSDLFLRTAGRANLAESAAELIYHTVRFRRRNVEKEYEQITIIEYLLKHIDADDRQTVLNEALSTAIWYGSYHPAKYLIKQGADINYVDNGKTMRELAENAITIFDDKRVLKLLEPSLFDRILSKFGF